MTGAPRRLRDDPDFRWETGCDLGDESLAVGEYDLPGLRERILAQAALPPPVAPTPVGTRWIPWGKPLFGVVSAAAVVGTAYWLGVQAGAERVAPPVEAPVAVVAPVTAPPVAPPSVDVAAPAPAPAPVVGAAPRPSAAPPVPPPSVAAPAPVEAPAVPRGPTRLQLENEALARANQMLHDEQYEQAAEQFEALRAIPGGLLVDEAEMGLLQAVVRMKDPERALALIETIESKPSFSGKRDEIARLRAESLVMSGRCEEALRVADVMPPKDAAAVRRSCRSRTKESAP